MSILTSPIIITKGVGETRNIGMDFSEDGWLDGATIVSVDGVTSTKIDGSASDLTIGSPSINGEIVEFSVSGGISCGRYIIKVTITDSNDQVLEGHGNLNVSSS